jgi:sulfide dehydrogenase [flavocytochrome c] flavoprotein subunit
MLTKITRRQFGAGLALVAVAPLARPALALGGAKVVVIGGGAGGATVAGQLKRLSPDLDVTLVEPLLKYTSCFFSNAYIGGFYGLGDLTHGYRGLSALGVNIVHDRAAAIDTAKRTVRLKTNKTLAYDRLVVAPGIDFKWDAIEGYSEEAAKVMPHAWRGRSQSVLLRKKLEAMEDGGTVVISVPGLPYRCPPGPYERASMIAYYLKTTKPRSKLLILDAKDKFSKQPLFVQGWEDLYPGMIEWIGGSDWGGIGRLDAANRTLYSTFDTPHKADVINLIPPQKAGAIAHAAGLVNADGWCTVDQRTFESTLHKDVYVIGDASVAGQMPKSGFAANSQGKVCAAALAAKFHAIDMPEPSYVNTCYSLVGPEYGISVAGIYRLVEGEIKSVEKSGGVSPIDADREFRQTEARYAVGWYQSIVSDSFG